MTDHEATFAESDVVQRQVATVMKALAPMGGTKEQSDACIALGRLAAWAEAAMHGHYRIEMRDDRLTQFEVSREMILDAFYDSVCGIFILAEQDGWTRDRILGELRHSADRCERQLDEAPGRDD